MGFQIYMELTGAQFKRRYSRAMNFNTSIILHVIKITRVHEY